MSRFDVVTVTAVGAAVVLTAAASFALLVTTLPSVGGSAAVAADPWASGSPTAERTSDETEVVVDVEGGVQRPGLHRLPADARVADALAAAGGYAEAADLAAAARSLNLAAPVADGQQIYVPVLGEASGASEGGGASEGLVNLNRASQSELEALPGIGPVTAERIIAARNEQPFTTLDELVTREVLSARQLEQIAELVTVP